MSICMIGAGYVGLVSAACFSDFGWEVTCVEKDGGKLAQLGRGEIPIYEPGLDALVAKNVRSGRLPRRSKTSPIPTAFLLGWRTRGRRPLWSVSTNP